MIKHRQHVKTVQQSNSLMMYASMPTVTTLGLAQQLPGNLSPKYLKVRIKIDDTISSYCKKNHKLTF